MKSSFNFSIPNNKNPWIVFITQISNQKGTGHFKRCLALSEFLNTLNYQTILIVQESLIEVKLNQNSIPILQFQENKACKLWLKTYASKIKLIIFDLGNLSEFQYQNLNIPLLSFDNLGTSQIYIDYLIEGLPNLQIKSHSQFKGESFLFLSDKVWKQASISQPKKKQILISFGGSDPFDLSFFTYQLLLSSSVFQGYSYIFVLGMLYQGKLNKMSLLPPYYKVKNPQNFVSLIQESSLIMTSFGLTPFEAKALNTNVLLINHTPYHLSLARKSNFQSLEIVGSLINQNFKKAILNTIDEIKSINLNETPLNENFLSPHNKNLKALLIHILQLPLIQCPRCKKRNFIILTRNFQTQKIQCQNDHYIFFQDLSFSLS